MESWKAAANKFLAECPFLSDIEVVYLTGSYAHGVADQYSDIDLYIILNDAVDWRERGNRNVDGFIIEYFANPFRQVKQYIETQHSDGNQITINMILYGIVIMDVNASADTLREYCLQKLAEPSPELDEAFIGVKLYAVWDRFNELERSYHNNSRDFNVQYDQFGIDVIYTYARFLKAPLPPYYHLYRWLTDEEYHKSFSLPKYPDIDFWQQMIHFFTLTDFAERFCLAEKMKTYVIDKMHGFDIDHYVFRSQSG